MSQEEHSPEHTEVPAQPRKEQPQQHTDAPFPTHKGSRVWFITAGDAPIAITTARRVIEHGDSVVACVRPFEDDGRGENSRYTELRAFLNELGESEGDAAARIKVICCDIRSVSDCQEAVAQAVKTFKRIDILLCCSSEAVIGTIEELSQSPGTDGLVDIQFSTNFFGAVNIIKACLPSFRSQRNGHVVLLTGITGHIGTPGLGMYCASQWAIEGYCDSLAYEVAPFNIKISILQSNIEVSILTNKITSVPEMEPYTTRSNPAPLARGIWSSILDRMSNSTRADASEEESSGSTQQPSDLLNKDRTSSLYPKLLLNFQENLIAETVHAILAIAGHENPPSRHIIGHEGVASVKEKLRTISEELEDFVECSGAVDL